MRWRMVHHLDNERLLLWCAKKRREEAVEALVPCVRNGQGGPTARERRRVLEHKVTAERGAEYACGMSRVSGGWLTFARRWFPRRWCSHHPLTHLNFSSAPLWPVAK